MPETLEWWGRREGCVQNALALPRPTTGEKHPMLGSIARKEAPCGDVVYLAREIISLSIANRISNIKSFYSRLSEISRCSKAYI